MMQERITSRHNPLMAQVKKLFAARSARYEQGLFAGDGTKLLGEAVRWCPALLRTVILSDGVEVGALPEHVRLVRVPESLMQQISPMQAPQGALFVCAMPEAGQGGIAPGSLVLDGIQDPGNLGTIIRTADALEVPLILTEGCADPYNPKTVRAAMGALFRTPPRQQKRDDVIADCRAAGLPLVATALTDRAEDIRALDLAGAVTVIGSEGRGVGEALLAAADRTAIIPMNPRCESLNAAVAATIVMWQLRR